MRNDEAELWPAVADDLRTLALLHDREPERELLEELRAAPMREWLGLRLIQDRGGRLIDEALAHLPDPIDEACLDELAADFADIHLVHALGASPAESPWIDPDGLICQEPMFQVRAWYRRYHVAAESWRDRPDDHLVLQLEFAAILAGLATKESIADLGRFLDHHALRWVLPFAERVGARCHTPYLAGTALLTADYLVELRDVVEASSGVPREVIPIERPEAPPVGEAAAAYMPGVAEGW